MTSSSLMQILKRRNRS